jgi:hypothetical protein
MRGNYARKTPACGEDFKSGHYLNSNLDFVFAHVSAAPA